MPLVPTLKAAAVDRGLIAADQPVDAATAFALVRDMPYRRASSREPAVTIAEWRGTCSGKHILLHALLEELGLAATMILAPHEFTEENSPWLPPALRERVRRAPIHDVHNFLRVRPDIDADWMTVDATWPLGALDLGLPANAEFIAGIDMQLAADPIEIHHVPPDADPMTLKQRILADLPSDELARRETFLADLIDWLGRALPDTGSV
ncbi:MAG: hypothetical protein O3A10_02965 [Chloroflexi bacterium]|nr:hypothetical protein [Chloroflexota bacterium]MDA1145133.1 hypothetical protein [Chloroflexota bacterium]